MNPASKVSLTENASNLITAINEAAIMAITDKRGIITYVNKKFCKISQYSESELIGKTHRIVNSNHHPKEFFEQMWNTISSGMAWEGEIRNRAKDGSYYWVNTTIVPFLDAQGVPELYIAVRYEITERKMAEEKLMVYAKRLEVSNQELTDFASVAAHDLQEPLRKIQSFADRVKLKTQGVIPADAVDYLDRLQSSAKRMQILINDLLTYSRVTTKARPFKPISLQQVLTDVCSDLEARIESNKSTVEFEDLPTIEADSTQMHQLFLNLVANGLKFHKPGAPSRVEVHAELTDEVMLGRVRPVCRITVKDNGIGFEMKYLDRIFTIFQRLHGRHEYEGTGIGLAVCRKIVDRHGGTLTAESSPGEGAAFVVSLPVKHSEGELIDEN